MRVCLRQVQFVLQHFNWWHCSVCRGYKPSLNVLYCHLCYQHYYGAIQGTITGVHVRLCTQTGNDLVQGPKVGFC